MRSASPPSSSDNDGSLPETVGDDQSMRNKSPPPSPDNDGSLLEICSRFRIEGSNWACTKCTLHNEASNTMCSGCGTDQSTKTTSEAFGPFSGGSHSGDAPAPAYEQHQETVTIAELPCADEATGLTSMIGSGNSMQDSDREIAASEQLLEPGMYDPTRSQANGNDGSPPETVGDDQSMRNKSPPPSPDNDGSLLETFSSIRIEGSNWACTKCTLHNEASNTVCSVCGYRKSRKTKFEACGPVSGGSHQGGPVAQGEVQFAALLVSTRVARNISLVGCFYVQGCRAYS
jgi:hypothetical protein